MIDTSGVVEQRVRIAARPETVFDLLSSAELMVRWMGQAVQLDPRPGGAYRIDVNGRDAASGTVLEIQPPRRLVLSFGWETADNPIRPGSTRVEIDLTPDGDGTLLSLRHSGLPADAVTDHSHGWEHYLQRLSVLAAGGQPGPDPFAQQVQP